MSYPPIRQCFPFVLISCENQLIDFRYRFCSISDLDDDDEHNFEKNKIKVSQVRHSKLISIPKRTEMRVNRLKHIKPLVVYFSDISTPLC